MMFGFVAGVVSGIVVGYFWNYPKGESNEYDFLLNDMKLSDKQNLSHNNYFALNNNTYNMTPTFNNNDDQLVFYYMDNCRFSTDFKPEWEKFEIHAKTLFPNMKVSKIAGPSDLCRERGIGAYPSVVLSKKDSLPVLFSGDRTVEGLTKFVQDNFVW